MATWNVIDVDFGGEETINFGPRLETGSALYQVDTTAVIHPQGKVTYSPRVVACCAEDKVCVATEEELAIFSQYGNTLDATSTQSNIIDVTSFTQDGSFLVFADQGGKVTLFDNEEKVILFSMPVMNAVDGGKIFQQATFTCDASYDGVMAGLLLLTTSGNLYLYTNMNLQAFKKALQSKDMNAMKSLKAKMVQTCIPACHVHVATVTSACMLTTPLGATPFTAGSGGCTLASWCCEDEEWNTLRSFPESQNFTITKMQPFNGNRNMLVLTDAGYLSIIIVNSFMLSQSWVDSGVTDFMLLDSDNASRVGTVLATRVCSAGGHSLDVCELRGGGQLEIVYTVRLGLLLQLAPTTRAQDTLVVVEGVSEEEPPGLPTSLRVRTLTEALPETRFTRLLNKGLFDEAEQFARNFNLNVECVYKRRCAAILEQMSPWHPTPPTPAEVAEDVILFKSYLAKISDVEHIVSCCLSAAPPDFDSTLSLLQYARERLQEQMETQNGHVATTDVETLERLLTQVQKYLHRLATFQVCFGVVEFDTADWCHFQMADLWALMLSYLAEGATATAFNIWRRHEVEFEVSLTVECVHELLKAVPETCVACQLAPWLAGHVVPTLLRAQPESLSVLAEWIAVRVRGMELLEADGWPLNAVGLCSVLGAHCEADGERGLLTPAEFAAQVVKLSVCTRAAKSDAVTALHTLTGHLHHLHELHTRYACRLSLADYLQETVESLTYRMLDRVESVEKVAATVRDTVQPYMLQHGLHHDKLLFQYIADLTERLTTAASYIGEAVFEEEKAIAVIACIKDAEYKGRAILSAATRAFTPWSAAMRALVDLGLALKHSRTAELRETVAVVRLRTLLADYDLRHYDMINKANARRLVEFILTQDRPSAVSDALAVVAAYSHLGEAHVYSVRARHLVLSGCAAQCCRLVRGLPHTTARTVAGTIIKFAMSVLSLADKTTLSPPVLVKMVMVTNAACQLITIVTDMDSTPLDLKEEYTLLMTSLRSMLALQTDFATFCSYTQFSCSKYRSQLLKKFVQAYYTGDKDCLLKGLPEDDQLDRKSGDRRMEITMTTLRRLATVLGYSQEEFQGELALSAVKCGQSRCALDMCAVLAASHPGDRTARVLHDVVLQLTRQLINPQAAPRSLELSAATLEIARRALTVCDPALLPHCLESAWCAQLCNDVTGQIEGGAALRESRAMTASSAPDPYSTWTFSPILLEDGLVMKDEDTSPLVYAYASSLLKHQLIEDECNEALMATLVRDSVNLAGHLKPNRQMELASRVILRSLARLHQFFFTCNNSCPERSSDSDLNATHIVDASDTAGGGTQIGGFIEKGVLHLEELIAIQLVKACSRVPVDHTLGIALACSLPKKKAFDRLQKISSRAGLQYKRIRNTSRIAADAAIVFGDEKVKQYCKDIENDASWGHRLAKVNISFTEPFTKAKAHLVLGQASAEHTPVQLLHDFCLYYSLPTQGLMLYVEQLLLPRPRHDGDAGVTQVDEYLAKAKAALALLPATNPEVLMDFVQRMDPYEHERLSYLLGVIYEKHRQPEIEQNLQLLSHLTFYERHKPPAEYERNFLMQARGNELMAEPIALPAAARTCLPYHVFVYGDPWKVITPELNAETVGSWLPIVSLLKLQSDQMYLAAIRNVVNVHLEGVEATDKAVGAVDKSACNWDPEDGIDINMFKKVAGLLREVQSGEMAVMCCSWMANVLPMGAGKVVALQSCCELAEHWFTQCAAGSEEQGKARTAAAKFTAYHCRLKTEQALFRAGLGEKELVSLAAEPRRLMTALYEHPAVTTRSPHAPDIHTLVDTIARINAVDASKVRQSLTDRWLPSVMQSRQDVADQTLDLTMVLADSEASTALRSEADIREDEVNLQRVIYLLRVHDAAAALLHSYANTDHEQVCPMSRARALRCLFALFHPSQIVAHTTSSLDHIKDQLASLMVVTDLERLRMSYSVTSFVASSKEGLVRSLLRNHRHEGAAVRLAADLCLDHAIYDTHLWDTIFAQLAVFQMTSYLSHVLVALSRVPELWQVACVHEAWRGVLLRPLASCTAPVSGPELAACLAAARLILLCPTLLDMNLHTLVRAALRLELPAVALSVALLIPHFEQRQADLQEIEGGYSREVILQQSEEWEERGLQVPMVEALMTYLL